MESKDAKVKKRSAKRVKTQLEMRYWIDGEDGAPEHKAQTIDLSSKSVLFEAHQLIAIGTEMRMELTFPSLDTAVRAEGWINRIQVKEKGQHYHYCLLFDIILEEHQEVIDKYIEIVDVDYLLCSAVEMNASDIHFIANHPPIFRIEGELVTQSIPEISPSDLKFMLLSMMTEKQQEKFIKRCDVNFSYFTQDGKRFRVNVHLDRGHVEATLRVIPSTIQCLDKLGLPPEIETFTTKTKGLVIIAGPAGSGKTTTLTSMVDTINRNRKCMIVSIEDPIEYLHHNQTGFVKQREVGADTPSLADGLKNIMRHDPDVIFTSELHDPLSVAMSILAAETGHLVLTTMNTSGIMEGLERLMYLIPADQREQIRSRIAGCLVGISAQVLLPRKDGNGRVVATEVMTITSTLRKLIREGQFGKTANFSEAGIQTGFHDLDDSLQALVDQDLIEAEVAMGFARKPERFRKKQDEIAARLAMLDPAPA